MHGRSFRSAPPKPHTYTGNEPLGGLVEWRSEQSGATGGGVSGGPCWSAAEGVGEGPKYSDHDISFSVDDLMSLEPLRSMLRRIFPE